MPRPCFCLFALLLACLSDTHASEQPVDLILANARVYTLSWGDPAPDGTLAADAPFDDQWAPDASAIAVREGLIVAVGTARELRSLQGLSTRIVDLKGATIVPGLVDSHTHVFGLGAALQQVDLTDVETEADAIERVVERAREYEPGTWIFGRGWDEGAWANRYPDKHLLSEAVPDHPVFLASLHGFAAWVNQAALDRLEITGETPVPSGGEIRKGPDGEPNGLFLNRAVELVRERIPQPVPEELMQRALTGLNQMARDGYVAVHDAGLDSEMVAALQALDAQRLLPIRVYGMLSLRDVELMEQMIERGPGDGEGPETGNLILRSVKAYYDGALGSRGARLLDDYADQPGHRGVAGSQYGFDVDLLGRAMRRGFQVAIHAIGDAGNRESLDIIERIYTQYPEARTSRHRIEHAQVIHPEDLPRFAELDLIASMEPPHAVEDKTWAEDRIGTERIRGAYAWRSLREAGVRLTFNSDNPGSDHNIFYGLHAAVTRRDKNREPADGWYPEEGLNIDEALRAYSKWSAYAEFAEDQTGVIAPGRRADLTVMNIDPFETAHENPGALLDGRIVMTVAEGQTLHADEHAMRYAQTLSLLGEPLYPGPPNADTLAKLDVAYEDYLAAPDDPDAIIWYGRRVAYTGDYRRAIEIFSEGIAKHPRDARMYRHRGHRFISLREFDQAVTDLEHAATLIEGTENQIEPDGLPNARNIPVSTLHGNIWYHLGLAYYLKHDWLNARRAYLKARGTGEKPDNLVSTTHWLYMIHRRMGDDQGATRMLEPIEAGFDVIENESYYKLCLFYKGLIDRVELTGNDDNPSGAAVAYGLANWDIYNGDVESALEQMRTLVDSASWAAFGFIAAEKDLAVADRLAGQVAVP